MKYCLALVIASVACVLGTPISDGEPIDPTFDALTQVRIMLTTRENLGNPIELRFRDLPSLEQSPFNRDRPTRVLIHGWTEDADSDIKVESSRELLAHYDFNVIFVDWSAGSLFITYAQAVQRVPLVGGFVASFLDYLHDAGKLDFRRTTVIGFSLGAHMAGIAGKRVTTGRIDSILGLDPAGPLFSVNAPANRLDAGDAAYVEALHTNGGAFGSGIGAPIADVDFFANGGSLQPGCITNLCHHMRAVALYIESINNNRFHGFRCSSVTDAQLSRCTSEPFEWFGGEPWHNKVRFPGIFFFPTNNRSPFAQGNPRP